MTDTTQIMIGKDWIKVSDGVCEVQSVNDRRAYDKIFFNLYIGDSVPTTNTPSMRITLHENANFHRPSPVWLKLDKPAQDQTEPVVVIK